MLFEECANKCIEIGFFFKVLGMFEIMNCVKYDVNQWEEDINEWEVKSLVTGTRSDFYVYIMGY